MGSWSFARVWGIELKVHVTFLLVVAFGALQWGSFGTEGLVFGAVLTLLTFVSVLLHELGHARVAQAFGIPVKDITLYPIGGVAQLRTRPKTPLQEFLIALAGPAVNVVLALALLGVGVWAFGRAPIEEGLRYPRSVGPSVETLVAMLISSNAVLAVFNLVPALPMDGGRVLRAALSGVLGAERATQLSAGLARVLAVGLFAAGLLLKNPMLSLVAVMVFVGAGAEVQAERLAFALDGVEVGDAMTSLAPRLRPDLTLGEAELLLKVNNYDAFAIVHGETFVGVVTRAALLDGLVDRGPHAFITSVMQRKVPAIDAKERLETARQQLEAHDLAFLAVVRDGRFAGLLTGLDLELVADRLARLRFSKQGPRRAGAPRSDP